jgi:DNA-binding NtrC family response regulator
MAEQARHNSLNDGEPAPRRLSDSPLGFATERVVPLLVGATVDEVERELVLQTLMRCHGNRTHAANVLGVSIRTLRNKLKGYSALGLAVPPVGHEKAAAREPASA